MTRTKRFVVALLAMFTLATAAAPAVLAAPRDPAPGSCGIGFGLVQLGLSEPGPGVSDEALVSPQEAGCTGN
jgi:hypothetical protein